MKQGDVVVLKSGGPLMTVEAVRVDGVLCVWFDEKNNHKQATFPEAMLSLYDDEAAAVGGFGMT